MRIFFWFWSCSFLIFIISFVCRTHSPEAAIFHHDFLLIKYAIDVAFINAALICFLWPFLISRKIIKADYNKEGEIEQAKIFLVIYGLMFPSILLIFIAAILTKEALAPSSLIFAIFCCAYLKKLFFFLKKRAN